MASARLGNLSDSLSDAFMRVSDAAQENKTAVAATAGGVTVALLASYFIRRARAQAAGKPSTFELSGGSIQDHELKQEWNKYEASFGKEAGQGIVDRSATTKVVDVFYSLVTDIYEWGWGQSFHFSPKLPMRDWVASEAAHEARVASILGLKPGMKALDAGCGVGGPMRVIAAVSGADVVGVTINQYQVDRATAHNAKQGLAPLTKVVQGNYLDLPFEANSFDAVYAIESTCHAPKLEDAYAQIFKVMKPGALFLSYEWVSTSKFNPNNPEHVKIIDEINFGNGLPEMRTWKQAEDAGKSVGFELVESIDLATASKVAGPWYDRLKMSHWQHSINHGIVSVLDFLHLAPKGVKDVHNMLVNVAFSLVAGGQTGVFTPMHMLVFRKPAAQSK